MNSRLIGYGCLALAMIGVGSTVAASRLAGAGLPPFTATALRFLIAFPLFWLLMRARGLSWPRLIPAAMENDRRHESLSGARRPPTRARYQRPRSSTGAVGISRHDLVLLVIQAGAGSVGYTVLLIAGTRLTSAADAGVMLGTLPAMSTLMAAAVLRERQTRLDWVAAALATAGALVVTFRPGGGQLSTHALAGNLLVLGAVGCEAVFILLNKRLRAPLSPLVQSAAMTGFGLVLAMVPAFLLERGWIVLGSSSATALAAVGYYALVPTVMGFLLWYAGAARTTGTEAALFTAFAPVSAVLFAALLFGDPLTPARIAGILLVLAGVLLVAVPRERRRP